MELATFLGISLLPILSPGPSSILAIRNSLRHGLRFATIRLMADLAGILLISSLLLSGLSALIINSQSLLIAIQMAGPSYVLVIGMTCLQARQRLHGRRPGQRSEAGGGETRRHDASEDAAQLRACMRWLNQRS
ncbi:LysE family transporter [Pseudomonas chlororaphis]|uniref:LysE family transporter n=1 Tax=Pseudomonas chlororaphis TaxID=587753 RepID=UPI001B302741|nr:LysE family transporter [Pseudomonas chlororaphis]MBP5058845.1 LysE family transporter [Pseudomonas chlororaphis]MBP5142963.1 LysE family transporter [Pseudomonas chlororaphis]QTT98274.1 LysE family transporter [Pseudomonas chlororaphis]